MIVIVEIAASSGAQSSEASISAMSNRRRKIPNAAALVADAYKQWVVGATDAQAYDVSVLFANAGNPGNPQVQTILKTLPHAS